ncbi:MAG: phosphatidate cytidylyltransferase [Flavobacteriales bacterium]|nr:phosphatidate cytidylyltransferase [Flavobacteriales bacterium]MCX7767985.1 phosphatidate cytidylyltransferase [Flavobacteriales bacterium]MDW8409190.1 phosphatidate cytidylyltransferase [Flavobacteriales bacterium]
MTRHPSENLRNLRKRTITGVFIVAVTLIGIRFSPHSYLLFLGLLSLGCSYEYFKVTSRQDSAFPVTGLLLGALIFVLHSFYILGFISGAVLIFITLLPVILYSQTIFSKSRRPFQDVSATLGGMAYTVLPFLCLSYLPINPIELREAKDYNDVYRWEIPMMYFIILMANDSFAYLAGRFLGRTKIAPAISPGKTLEGFVGGAVGAAILVYFLKDSLLEIDASIRNIPWKQRALGDTRILFQEVDWYILLALTVGFGFLGDLAESRLKRSLHIKHSSNFFPGHGGFLDRYDSLLLSAIPVFLYVYFFKYA